MNEGGSETFYGRIFRGLHNNRFVACLLIVVAIVVGLGAFTDSLQAIGSFSKKYIWPGSNINELITLRKDGDALFANALRFKSADVPKIAEWVTGWERRVEQRLSKISQVSLNKFQSARNRRSGGVYFGRNASYARWLNRLEVQIQALNKIIEGIG